MNLLHGFILVRAVVIKYRQPHNTPRVRSCLPDYELEVVRKYRAFRGKIYDNSTTNFFPPRYCHTYLFLDPNYLVTHPKKRLALRENLDENNA